MKKQDFLFVFVLIVIFLPFFVSDAVYGWYKSFNATHGMVMSFLKFGVLATLGEMLGLRISAGVYNRKGFGVLSRAVVWGILGMGINMAMIVFSKGVPQFMEYMGMADASAIINGGFCLDKLWIALAIICCHEHNLCPCIHDISQDNGYTYSGLWRFASQSYYAYSDDAYHYAS